MSVVHPGDLGVEIFAEHGDLDFGGPGISAQRLDRVGGLTGTPLLTPPHGAVSPRGQSQLMRMPSRDSRRIGFNRSATTLGPELGSSRFRW